MKDAENLIARWVQAKAAEEDAKALRRELGEEVFGLPDFAAAAKNEGTNYVRCGCYKMKVIVRNVYTIDSDCDKLEAFLEREDSDALRMAAHRHYKLDLGVYKKLPEKLRNRFKRHIRTTGAMPQLSAVEKDA